MKKKFIYKEFIEENKINNNIKMKIFNININLLIDE